MPDFLTPGEIDVEIAKTHGRTYAVLKLRESRPHQWRITLTLYVKGNSPITWHPSRTLGESMKDQVIDGWAAFARTQGWPFRVDA